jgi:hypothetical protein
MQKAIVLLSQMKKQTKLEHGNITTPLMPRELGNKQQQTYVLQASLADDSCCTLLQRICVPPKEK